MLPIDLEPEEVDVELNGLDFIEDPQDRGGFAQAHRVAPRRKLPGV
jgi:hypothetical protein